MVNREPWPAVRHLALAVALLLCACRAPEGATLRHKETVMTLQPIETPAPTATATQSTAPSSTDTPSTEAPLMIGAYWYPWFGPGRRHWEEGHLGEPVLGEYDSADPDVIRQQITWASDHGIDLFVASWWGQDSKEDRILSTALPGVIEESDFRFAILYETPGLLGMEDGHIGLRPEETQQRLLDDVIYLAQTYFDHPNYLRIADRPVLFFYLTRTFSGDVQATMDAVRSAVAAETGAPAFIIADEVYWHIAVRQRIRPFDGITAYNMHTSVAGIADDFPAKVTRKYASWAAAAEAESIAFVPDILPGFDDTGVRPEAHHPPIPRSEDGFRQQLTDAIALAHGPTRLVMITSWNEWHEFTSIEPGVSFGTTYLEIVRDVTTE